MTTSPRLARLVTEYGIPVGTSPSHVLRGDVGELRASLLCRENPAASPTRQSVREACPCPHPFWLHRLDGACQHSACDCVVPSRVVPPRPARRLLPVLRPLPSSVTVMA
jgi:hypothetical protein